MKHNPIEITPASIPVNHEVTDADTAAALGSRGRAGARHAAADRLDGGGNHALRDTLPRDRRATVGTAIRIEHRCVTPVGGTVEITTKPPPRADGRRLTPTAQAADSSGHVVAAGQIDRAIVDRQRFLAVASGADAGR